MSRRVARFLLALLAPVLLLTAAELCVRALGPASLEPQLLQPEAGRKFFGARMLLPVEKDGVRYAGRPGARVRIRDVEYRHNADGLRAPDLPGETGDRFVIALLGDSNVYAWGTPVEDGMAARLERLLSDARPRPLVVPLAFPGYNTRDQAALLEQRFDALQPDLVVLAWFANDLERLGFHVGADGALFCDPLPVPDRVKPLLWRSRLYRLASLARLRALRASSTISPTSERTRRFAREQVLRIRDFAAARGAGFCIVDVPVLEPSGTTQRMRREGYPHEDAASWIADLARAERVPFLSLLDAVEGEPTALLWASIEHADHHPNARAHELFARALSAFLREYRLVP